MLVKQHCAPCMTRVFQPKSVERCKWCSASHSYIAAGAEDLTFYLNCRCFQRVFRSFHHVESCWCFLKIGSIRLLALLLLSLQSCFFCCLNVMHLICNVLPWLILQNTSTLGCEIPTPHPSRDLPLSKKSFCSCVVKKICFLLAWPPYIFPFPSVTTSPSFLGILTARLKHLGGHEYLRWCVFTWLVSLGQRVCVRWWLCSGSWVVLGGWASLNDCVTTHDGPAEVWLELSLNAEDDVSDWSLISVTWMSDSFFPAFVAKVPFSAIWMSLGLGSLTCLLSAHRRAHTPALFCYFFLKRPVEIEEIPHTP